MTATDTQPQTSPATAYLSNLPTVIVAGSPYLTQSMLDAVGPMPVNLIVLNHAIARYQFDQSRIVWAVFDPPSRFPDVKTEHLQTARGILVPEYMAAPWRKSKFARLPIESWDYQYVNVFSRDEVFSRYPREVFNWTGTCYGFSNCLCAATAYALRHSEQPVYLLDAELSLAEYRGALKTFQFWAKDRQVQRRLRVMNPAFGRPETQPGERPKKHATILPLASFKDLEESLK